MSFSRADCEKYEHILTSEKIVEVRKFPVLLGTFTYGVKYIGVTESGYKVLLKPFHDVRASFGEMYDTTNEYNPRHEVAVYQISKMLETSLIPPSVLKEVEINGKKETVMVQLWISGAKRFESKQHAIFSAYTGGLLDILLRRNPSSLKRRLNRNDEVSRQINAMLVLDYLANIHDRKPVDVLIDKTGQIFPLDNGFAFESRIHFVTSPPALESLAHNTELESTLKKWNHEILQPLRQWLTPDEIDGILSRRDRLLKFWETSDK